MCSVLRAARCSRKKKKQRRYTLKRRSGGRADSIDSLLSLNFSKKSLVDFDKEYVGCCRVWQAQEVYAKHLLVQASLNQFDEFDPWKYELLTFETQITALKESDPAVEAFDVEAPVSDGDSFGEEAVMPVAQSGPLGLSAPSASTNRIFPAARAPSASTNRVFPAASGSSRPYTGAPRPSSPPVPTASPSRTAGVQRLRTGSKY